MSRLTLRCYGNKTRMSPRAMVPFSIVMNLPTIADLYRMLEGNFDRQVDRMRSHFYRQDKKLVKLTGMMRATNQR